MKQWRPLLVLLSAYLILLLLPASESAAQAPTMPLQSYETLVREGHAAAQRHDMIGLRTVSERLLTVERLELAPGTSISVHNGWLDAEMQSDRPDLDQVADQLGTLLEVLAQAHPDDPQAIQKLQEVLSRAPFNPEEQSWIERFLDSISEFLDGLFESNSDPTLAPNAVPNVELLLTLLAAAVLSVLIFYIARLARGVIVREARTRKPAAEEDEPTTSTDAVSRADELAVGGDYRSAMRYLYLSTLLWLHEHRYLHYDRALTNIEVLRSISPESPLHARLQPVVHTFDRVWYGHHELNEPAFEQFRRQVTGLREGQP